LRGVLFLHGTAAPKPYSTPLEVIPISNGAAKP
jgi:hypothetical protein